MAVITPYRWMSDAELIRALDAELGRCVPVDYRERAIVDTDARPIDAMLVQEMFGRFLRNREDAAV